VAENLCSYSVCAGRDLYKATLRLTYDHGRQDSRVAPVTIWLIYFWTTTTPVFSTTRLQLLAMLSSILIVYIDSIAAALTKLNIKVPIEDLVKVIHEEDEARRAKEAAQRPPVPSGSESTPQPTESKSDSNSTKPSDVDPLVRERRRRRILELTEEAFPDGNVPPYRWMC